MLKLKGKWYFHEIPLKDTLGISVVAIVSSRTSRGEEMAYPGVLPPTGTLGNYLQRKAVS